jgi:hypothetical protein
MAATTTGVASTKQITASKIKRNGRAAASAKMWRGGVGRKENDGEERKAGIEDGGGESELQTGRTAKNAGNKWRNQRKESIDNGVI